MSNKSYFKFVKKKDDNNISIEACGNYYSHSFSYHSSLSGTLKKEVVTFGISYKNLFGSTNDYASNVINESTYYYLTKGIESLINYISTMSSVIQNMVEMKEIKDYFGLNLYPDFNLYESQNNKESVQKAKEAFINSKNRRISECTEGYVLDYSQRQTIYETIDKQFEEADFSTLYEKSKGILDDIDLKDVYLGYKLALPYLKQSRQKKLNEIIDCFRNKAFLTKANAYIYIRNVQINGEFLTLTYDKIDINDESSLKTNLQGCIFFKNLEYVKQMIKNCLIEFPYIIFLRTRDDILKKAYEIKELYQ